MKFSMTDAAILQIRHIETINEGYKDLADGKIDGRIVYHFH